MMPRSGPHGDPHAAGSQPSPLGARLEAAILPAVPVPFHADGTFAADAQERYVQYMSRQPVSGVAVWAHTGRGLHLPEDLAIEILRSWRGGLPGKLIVAGAGCRPDAAGRNSPPGSAIHPLARQFAPLPLPEGEALRGRPEGAVSAEADAEAIAGARAMARRAAGNGADAVLAFPPVRFRDREPSRRRDLILEYHRELAAAGLPVIAFYLYESAGGLSYTDGELRDILGIARVEAIKVATLDSIVTYQDLSKLFALEFPGKILLSGEDRFLGYSLLRGASGALIGMGAACPAFQGRLIETALEVRRGIDASAAELVRLSLKADRLAECTFIEPMEGYIGRMLHALSALGVIPAAAAHDPWFGPVPATERDAIERTLREIGEL